MGKLYSASLAASALALLSLAAPLAGAQNVPSPDPKAPASSGVSSELACDPCCDAMRGCARLGCWQTRYASYGYDACNCHGSYKFPVPPQYTYHWPGMYSQQWMTEYNSPYRFPPLEIPEEYAQMGNGGLLPRAEPAAGSATRLDTARKQSLPNARWNAKPSTK